jgi:hypothetical protein
MRKLAFLFVVLALSCLGVSADTSTPISITSFGTAFSEDFDTLASTLTSSATPAGWGFLETSTNANATYTAGTGSSGTGDTYSFGSSGSSERALGGLLSGTLVPLLGAQFTNNTGGTITSLDIGFTGEHWRLGATGRNDHIDFQYSTDATSLTSGTYVSFAPLDFNAPTPNATNPGTVGALNGNLAANRTAISSTLTA